jgi:hypothetical protein
MSTELVKVNPKEYGLEDNQVQTIEQAFLPKIKERESLTEIYGQLITKELSEQTCKDAKEVRLKLVKVRTGIAEIHKTQKAYFLAAGRFVDAWKNKEVEPIEQMEAKLSEIEKYYENLERERLQKLESERLELTKQFTEFPAANLSLMASETFEAYLTGLKVAYESKIKAENDAEIERLRLIEVDKENARLKAIEDERIRKENEALKLEAEKKEKQLQAERKKQADILAEQKRISEVEAKKQADIIAKQKAELKAKEDAELKAKQEKESFELEAKKQAEKAAKAPKKEKLTKWVNDFKIDIPLGLEKDTTVLDIVSKFEAFKNWSKTQINNL